MFRLAQQQQQQLAAFEAQTSQEAFTEAELEELTVRKRREEGTPCTKENFEKWKAEFDAEMWSHAVTDDEDDARAKKGARKGDDKTGRITGFEYFRNTGNNLEALEAAEKEAEEAEIDVDEELFEDDVDLDDLDFEEDDDDVDEVDI